MQGDCRKHNDDKHYRNANPHDFPEEAVAAGPDQDDGSRTMQNSVENLVGRFTAQRCVYCEAGDADGAHQHGPDQETPKDQIAQEEALHRLAKMFYASLQKRMAGGQLPSGKTLVEYKLEKGSQQNGPQDGQTEHAAGERGGGQVSRANPRGGNENPRANEGRKSPFSFRHAGGSCEMLKGREPSALSYEPCALSYES